MIPDVALSPPPVILEDSMSTVEPISPAGGGVIDPWANDCLTVKVPAIKEAVARILAIANKDIIHAFYYLILLLIVIIKNILRICYTRFIYDVYIDTPFQY